MNHTSRWWLICTLGMNKCLKNLFPINESVYVCLFVFLKENLVVLSTNPTVQQLNIFHLKVFNTQQQQQKRFRGCKKINMITLNDLRRHYEECEFHKETSIISSNICLVETCMSCKSTHDLPEVLVWPRKPLDAADLTYKRHFLV